MFIAKRHIPRRTFLRGAGVTLALPLLEAMVPALTPMRLTAASPIKRFVGIWHPHGAAPGYWSPTKEGKHFDFSFITKPLEPFRDRTVLITGLDMPEAMATDEEPGGDHARGAVLLSGARPRRNAVSPFLGETIDQTIAKKYGQDTILQSLQLGVEDTGNFGNCNWGYSCAYTNSVSWSSATQPLPTQVNPRVVFDRLFGDITRSATFMLGRDLTGASFPESGFTGGWHGSSHHGDKPENVANYAKMNRYHVQNLAYFLEKLRAIPEGDGTVLDHILIYKGSNMGNSHRHAHEKVPVILVGGIDGTFKGNRHIVFPDNTQRTSNMLLSILQFYGIPQDEIGTSNGPLQPVEIA